MSRGIKLFRVLGIGISIDYTWFVVFVLFAWSLGYGYFPMKLPGLGRLMYLGMGVVSSLLLFICVLIHEISHSYVSNRLGLPVHGITLFIFGGVAELTKEPEDAATELKIAIAGPAASAALALAFWGISATLPETSHPAARAIAGYLVMINAMLLAFNMIPGFPLDGGRVLRALWWARTGDVKRATEVASMIGKGFAMFLILTGVLQIFFGNFTNGLWSVLIGVFLQQAAEGGYRRIVMKKALEGVTVREIMTKDVVTIREDETISSVVEHYFFKFHYVGFPVASEGRLVGMLNINSVRKVDKGRWETALVRDVMDPLGPADALRPDDGALEALQRLTSGVSGRLPVTDGGKIVGMVSRRDIMRLLELKAGLNG